MGIVLTGEILKKGIRMTSPVVMMEIIQLTLINNTYIDLRKAAIAINMQSHSSYYLYLILRA